MEYPFIAITPSVVAPDRVLSMGQIELNCVSWDGTVLTFKLCTYAKLNCFCPVSWGCRICHMLLSWGVTPPPQRVSWYDTKQSDNEVLVMLELWVIRSTPSLPSLPGPLWPRVVAPEKGPIYALNRTKLISWVYCFFAFKLCIYAKLNYLK